MKSFVFIILLMLCSPNIWENASANYVKSEKNQSLLKTVNLLTKEGVMSDHNKLFIDEMQSANNYVKAGNNSSVPKTENIDLSSTKKVLSALTTITKSKQRVSTSLPNTKKSSSQSKIAAYVNLPVIREADDTFRDIRTQNKIFVDKTQFIRLLHAHRMVYLTRPHGFGKSIFIQMLYEYFKGNKEYFENTAIYNRGNKEIEDGKWMEHPVIHIDFSPFQANRSVIPSLRANAFALALESYVHEVARSYGVELEEFLDIGWLIEELHDKYKLPVFIVIDGSDNPFTCCEVDDKQCEEEMSTNLCNFYYAFKGRSPYIGLLFVTGVRRLRFNDISGGWNNYVDITFDENFSSAMGFTADEVEVYFGPHMKKFAFDQGVEYEDVFALLLQWFDGYLFAGNGMEVLNPTSTCEYLRNQELGPPCVPTEKAKIVVDKMRAENLPMSHFEPCSLPLECLRDLSDLPSQRVPLNELMFQYGYLTIKEYISRVQFSFVTLKYPNIEIRMALRQLLLQRERASWIALIYDDVQSFFAFLNAYGFSTHNLPLDHDILTEQEATRAIIRILKATNVEYIDVREPLGVEQRNEKEATVFNVNGDIDIMITSVRPRYTIKVKVGRHGAVTAILQLISYIIRDENAFKKAIYPDNTTRLVGINVERTMMNKRNIIREWIYIPYIEGTVWICKMEASDSNKFREELKQRCLRNGFIESTKLVF